MVLFGEKWPVFHDIAQCILKPFPGTVMDLHACVHTLSTSSLLLGRIYELAFPSVGKASHGRI